jgi:hypothetical protein
LLKGLVKIMKKEILFFAAGALTTAGITAFAAQLDVNPNSFPITLNGDPIEIEGYNLDGNTYFKLRDIGDKLGFDVDFENDTIVITKSDRSLSQTSTAPAFPGLPEQLPEGEGSTPEETLTELKDRLAQKVAAGEMTQAEADELLERFGQLPQSASEQ